MSLEENKAVVRRLYEGINDRDLDVFEEVLSPDYVHRSEGYSFDRAALKDATVSMGLRAFPDLHATIDEMIAEDDKVMVRWTQRGTHLGPFLDVPATGRSVTYSGINIFPVVNGQILEDTPHWDFSAVMAQLRG